jgi:hypothetical protein
MENCRMKPTIIQNIALSTLALLFAGHVMAQDPSMSEVYKAAESGNFAQADAMMKQVLADHPNSGKAHFVQAEIFAKEGRAEAARDELQIAQKLAPGLPFAKPQAVSELEAKLAAPVASTPSFNNNYNAQPQHVPASEGPSLLPWVLGFAALAFILFIYRLVSGPRNVYAPMPAPGYGAPPAAPMQPYGYGPTPMGPSGPSMGSGILGGLATGAAVGAGMVAGEALMHNVLGEHGSNGGLSGGNGFQDNNNYQPPAPSNYDMGGNNFGVQDSSSWDDSSSSSGSDDW